MSKGSPIIKTRIKPLLLARVQAELKRRFDQGNMPNWTISDFITECIIYRLSEADRKKKYKRKKRL